MSEVTFTCPDCGHPLTSHNNLAIKGIHDFEGTISPDVVESSIKTISLNRPETMLRNS